MSYAQGAVVRLTGTFKTGPEATPPNQFVDPQFVKLVIVTPSDVSTVLNYPTDGIIKDSVGVYHYDLDTSSQPGPWRYGWYSTGAGQAAAPVQSFDVVSSGITEE